MELRQVLMRGMVLVGLVMGGCATTRDMLGGNNGQTYTLNASPKVPAATGKVSVSTEKNGNHTVDINVERLAEPQKVFEGASTYVVWLIAPGTAPTNIGVLPLDNDLKGRLETKTPFKTFRVEVTAEPTASATQPTDTNRVMTASVRLPS